MYHLANTANVQAISKKMIEFLDQIKGDNKKKDLIDKILHLAEVYPFNTFYYSGNLFLFIHYLYFCSFILLLFLWWNRWQMYIYLSISFFNY